METWLTRFDWCTRQSWRSPTGMSFWPAGRMTTGPRLIVIHSTETVGFPGYRGGADAPHFTIDLPSGQVRQHVPLEWGSRCLAVSTGGVTDRTVNITGTIQIEVIGAVTPGYPRTYGHYDLPNRFPTDTRAQQHLARLIRAIHDATNRAIPLQLTPVTWVRYPDSYGVRARQRLSSAIFASVRGILGHQHAPANSHGDGVLGRAVSGGAPDLQKVVALAVGSGATPPPADVKVDAGSLWAVTADALNCRLGPGTEWDIIGVGTKGMTLRATGKSSGPWIEAQSPYQIDHGIRAWWHSGFLAKKAAVDPAEPDELDRAIQRMLEGFGYSLAPDGADGYWGPITQSAAERYAKDAGYQGGINDRRALLNHMEATVKAILDAIDGVPRATAEYPYKHAGSVSQFANYAALANRRAWQLDIKVEELKALLEARAGATPEEIGRAMADSLRGDVVAAIGELDLQAGASADEVAQAVVSLMGAALTSKEEETV